MRIEVLSIENLKALTGLVLELWTDCDFEEELKEYEKMIGSPDDAIYLAKEGEEHIAFIHTSIRRDYVEGADEMPVAYVEAIYVKPAFQKRGIARDLISAAEKWAMQKGLKQIGSDTDTTNPPSIEFHKAVGFTEVERIVCFIKNLE